MSCLPSYPGASHKTTHGFMGLLWHLWMNGQVNGRVGEYRDKWVDGEIDGSMWIPVLLTLLLTSAFEWRTLHDH